MHYADYNIKHLNKTGTRKSFMVLKTWTWIQDHGKGNTVPVHATKVFRGNRGTAPLILNLSTTWR
jgi:hypothetical protein